MEYKKCDIKFINRLSSGAVNNKSRELCFALNHTPPGNILAKKKIIKALLPSAADNIEIMPPFYCEFGLNCVIGSDSFIGYNSCFCDYEKITVGSGCYIGPNCSIYTFGFLPQKSISPISQSVNIGDNVYICGDVKIMPGVNIGEGSVICAGSVVCSNIPPHTLAAGNPCMPVGKAELI